MKRILPVLLMICVLFTAIMPMTAYAAEPDTVSAVFDSESVHADEDASDAAVPADAPEEAPAAITEDAPAVTPAEIPADVPEETPEASENEPPSDVPVITLEIPAEETAADISEETPEIVAEEPTAEACEEQILQISPFSEFTGEDNEFFTRIRLTVTDRQGNLLSGAVYGLYTMNGQLVEYLTPDSYGAATSGDVLVDTDYYVEEITSPEGYQPYTERSDIILTEVSAPSLMCVTIEYDPITGSVKVIKTDGENPLAGAMFAVFDGNGVQVCELTTGADGAAAYANLTWGAYTLKELSAPAGYVLLPDTIHFEVREQDEIVEITVVNEKEPVPDPTPAPDLTDGRIRLIKKDADTGKLLAGAVFGVYTASSDIKVCELTTDANGEAVSPLLTQGEYYLKELSAPAGYELSTEKYGVTVKADNTVKITVTNVKAPDPTPDPDPTDGRIRLIKKDAETGKLLTGAVFGVYTAFSDIKVCELTTDTNGEAVSPLLTQGEYYLKELSAPTGYALSAEKYGVTVKADKTVDITVTNVKTSEPTPTPDPTPTQAPNTGSGSGSGSAPIPVPATKGELLIIKKSEQTGNPLQGAVFGVYKAEGDVKVTELTTNTDGKAALTLEPGKYYLKELKSPYGYLLEPVKIYFTVTAGVTVKVEVTNIRDGSIPDGDNITIPKTGMDFPAASYALAAFLLGIALLCCVMLYRGRKLKAS